MLLAFGPTAGASTASVARATPSASQIAAARTFIEHLAVGQHGTNHQVPGQASRIEGLTKVDSTNWSGYADTGSGFKSIKAKWIEPGATCGSATSLAAFWVGIDGFSSASVEQDGTLIECDGGTAFYFTWWEMYPTNDIQVVGETLAPGDSIAASVVRSGTSYKLAVTDSTHPANSFSTTQSCTDCANSSAEVIAEAPCCVSGTTPYPLSNFGTFKATGATVDGKSISSFTDDEITMVNGTTGKVEAKPGALSSTGKVFKVVWKSA